MPIPPNNVAAKWSNSSESHVSNSSPIFQNIAYALPVMSISLLFSPMSVVNGIYAKHFGVTLTTIAAVLPVSRLFDAITDPCVVFFSDWRRARSGTRKSLILFGAVFFIIASYFSLYTLMNKSAGALGAAAGLMIFGWYGFDPSAPTFSTDTEFVVRLSLAGLPVPLLLLSMLLVALIPINTRYHRMICQRLEARASRCSHEEPQQIETNVNDTDIKKVVVSA